jgi:hypothetical protein
MNKNFRTSIVYVFWEKVDGLLRIDIEIVQNIARKLLTRARIARKDAPIPNQKEKLDGRKIRTTAVSRIVREIPFGIDKTDGSHAQLITGGACGQHKSLG